MNFVHDTGEKWRKLRSNSIKLKELKWWHDNARPRSSKETTLFLKEEKLKKFINRPIVQILICVTDSCFQK